MKHTNQRRLLVKQIMERSDGIKPYINKRTRTVSVFGDGMVDWDRFEIVIEEELGALGHRCFADDCGYAKRFVFETLCPKFTAEKHISKI